MFGFTLDKTSRPYCKWRLFMNSSWTFLIFPNREIPILKLAQIIVSGPFKRPFKWHSFFYLRCSLSLKCRSLNKRCDLTMSFKFISAILNHSKIYQLQNLKNSINKVSSFFFIPVFFVIIKKKQEKNYIFYIIFLN